MASYPQTGETFGPYTILGRLGQGGMGVVFRAFQPKLNREVALKVLLPHHAEVTEFRDRFTREAALLAAMSSPHIIAIHDFGEHNGCLFIATPLVAGGDLAGRMSAGPLEVPLALTVIAQVASALSAAHHSGVVHRDVKPTNVLLSERDGEPHAFLCDFGIARAENDSLTKTGTVIGTYAYLAPERIAGGDATPSSDIYSLGCMLVATVTGQAPYQGTDLQVAQHHLHSSIPQWQETTPLLARLNHLVRTSMAKDPADRYPTAADFRRDLLATAAEHFGGVAPGSAGSTPGWIPGSTPGSTPGRTPGWTPGWTPTPGALPMSPDPTNYRNTPGPTEIRQTPVPGGTGGVPGGPDTGTKKKGRGAVVAALAVLVALAVIGGGILLSRDNSPNDKTSDQPTGGTTGGTTGGPTATSTAPQGEAAKEACRHAVPLVLSCAALADGDRLHLVFKDLPTGCKSSFTQAGAAERIAWRVFRQCTTTVQRDAGPTVTYAMYKNYGTAQAYLRDRYEANGVFAARRPTGYPDIDEIGPVQYTGKNGQIGYRLMRIYSIDSQHPYSASVTCGQRTNCFRTMATIHFLPAADFTD